MYLVPSTFSAAIPASESTGISASRLADTFITTRTTRFGSVDRVNSTPLTLPIRMPFSRTGAPSASAAESRR